MEQNHKRQYRELDDETKRKIADSLRGRPKSDSHAQNISQGLKNYWETVPNRPAESGENNESTNPKPNDSMR